MLRLRQAYWDLLALIRSAPDRARAVRAWAGGHVVRVGEVAVRIDRSFSIRMVERLIEGSYESKERVLVGDLIEDDDVVFEIGAGLGVISAYCARRIGSDRVFAFEANPAMEKLIRETYRLNEVSPTLTMAILGQMADEARFYVNREFWESSTQPGLRGEIAETTVPVRPVNEELRACGANFLVIDIEGAEYEVFRHIDLSRIDKLVIEFHPGLIGEAKTEFVRERIRAAGLVEQIRDGMCSAFVRRPVPGSLVGSETALA